ncbi:hypothetical protein Lgee_1421 [Legionella geestiana]|uniref:Uncharacterized protein n=1 Tax=Legionella geestiana TaxID=45065 RepID=A0A0W0TTJ8_9GAMM|nr:hypothetical protein [Legionella geestiana]KTC98844.1 hypothetical protein Lgee_1421 [Legionella geestiana]QBS12764.1 hypothetical protein E4T54_08410 [Legionella geestiana]QDQ39519.1 hypothetical protein E3226_003445 [Legionella geestiana]STX54762.1 Uncharacterised protein [Legionella geestiana]
MAAHADSVQANIQSSASDLLTYLTHAEATILDYKTLFDHMKFCYARDLEKSDAAEALKERVKSMLKDSPNLFENKDFSKTGHLQYLSLNFKDLNCSVDELTAKIAASKSSVHPSDQNAQAMNAADFAIIRIFLVLHFMADELPFEIKLQKSAKTERMLATAVEHIEAAILDILARALNRTEWNALGTGVSGMFGRAPEGIRNMRALLANPALTPAEKFSAIQKEARLRTAPDETTRDSRVQDLYETLSQLPESLIEVAKNPVLLQQLRGQRTVAKETAAPAPAAP